MSNGTDARRPVPAPPRLGDREHTRIPAPCAALLTLTITLGGLTITGCSGGGSPRASEPTVARAVAAEELWQRAEVARVAGRHEEAALLYSTFHRSHPTDPRSTEALLDAGTELRRAGRVEEARNQLLAAASRGDPRITPHAWLQLGYLERTEDQFAGAAMRFRDAAITATDDETRAEALLEAGLALQRAGAFTEARAPLEQCLRLAAAAPRHAQEAREALKIPGHFTVQVGVFEARERAEQLMAQLQADGFPAQLEEDGAEPRFRVTSGRFARRPEVITHADRLQARGYPVWIKP
ncbi:MAG: tetratricopeptide repeat protein [Planctomycetota bacterium]